MYVFFFLSRAGTGPPPPWGGGGLDPGFGCHPGHPKVCAQWEGGRRPRGPPPSPGEGARRVLHGQTLAVLHEGRAPRLVRLSVAVPHTAPARRQPEVQRRFPSWVLSLRVTASTQRLAFPSLCCDLAWRTVVPKHTVSGGGVQARVGNGGLVGVSGTGSGDKDSERTPAPGLVHGRSAWPDAPAPGPGPARSRLLPSL